MINFSEDIQLNAQSHMIAQNIMRLLAVPAQPDQTPCSYATSASRQASPASTTGSDGTAQTTTSTLEDFIASPISMTLAGGLPAAAPRASQPLCGPQGK